METLCFGLEGDMATHLAENICIACAHNPLVMDIKSINKQMQIEEICSQAVEVDCRVSADGAHAPYIPAGADTESRRKAAGTAEMPKTTSSRSIPQRRGGRPQVQPVIKVYQKKRMPRVLELELGIGSKSSLQNMTFPVPQACTTQVNLFPSCPCITYLASFHIKSYILFTPQINPEMAYAQLFCGMWPSIPPFQTFHMSTNAY
ncbi:hypothetical protein HF521_011549 [Silurus meridionalis]|uniref:Uncharacterized protein n=1 Tax=Silurus meridionalis TaxID=175797 RepID=A0A8T0AI75_SILME|nr:hypothetical protein HF521_011549 [Silurus meridionalis]